MPVRGQTILRADGTLETKLVRTPVTGNVQVVRAILDKEPNIGDIHFLQCLLSLRRPSSGINSNPYINSNP